VKKDAKHFNTEFVWVTIPICGFHMNMISGEKGGSMNTEFGGGKDRLCKYVKYNGQLCAAWCNEGSSYCYLHQVEINVADEEFGKILASKMPERKQ